LHRFPFLTLYIGISKYLEINNDEIADSSWASGNTGSNAMNHRLSFPSQYFPQLFFPTYPGTLQVPEDRLTTITTETKMRSKLTNLGNRFAMKGIALPTVVRVYQTYAVTLASFGFRLSSWAMPAGLIGNLFFHSFLSV
jgi:hypothetical protein